MCVTTGTAGSRTVLFSMALRLAGWEFTCCGIRFPSGRFLPSAGRSSAGGDRFRGTFMEVLPIRRYPFLVFLIRAIRMPGDLYPPCLENGRRGGGELTCWIPGGI